MTHLPVDNGFGLSLHPNAQDHILSFQYRLVI